MAWDAMRIFLSYAREDESIANEVDLKLVALGHDVFFDRSDLPDGSEYDMRVRRAIEHCDLFVLLLSPASVQEGRYSRTELSILQRRWRHPSERLLPIMIRETPLDRVPPYVTAVT